MITTRVIRFVQEELKTKGQMTARPNGKLDATTEKALRKALTRRRRELPEDWESWPRTRIFTAYVQLRCRDEGVDPGPVDGYWGTQTDHAVDVIRNRLQHQLKAPPFRDSDDGVQKGAEVWPLQTEDELRRFFGPVAKNLVRIELPYEHRLAWDKTKRIRSYSCHEKVHDSLLRVLTRVLDHYGEDGIRELRLDLWGGCFNKRKKKGGTTWSMHAWAIAVDYDPENNRFKWGWEKAGFARPEYEPWWKIWEGEGWTSLGRARNFDWMHIQAARLR
jgi:hypothetical protein